MGRWYRYTAGVWVGQDGAILSSSPSEYLYWQHRAALLDPDAYDVLYGTSQSDTVTANEIWYVVNAWYVDSDSSGLNWFQRPADVNRAHPLPEGHTLETGTSSASMFYLCKPELVISGDSRYIDDPRGLYYERLMRMATLTQYQVGDVDTGNSGVNESFPADFTNGLALHTSSHDVAWLTLQHSTGNTAMNTLNEISDTNRIRFAEPTLFPFKRTTWPTIRVRGASETEGRAVLTYVKLPGDW